MDTALEPAASFTVQPLPRRANPYDVYLDSLSNEESRRSMRRCLDRIAEWLAEDLSADRDEPFEWPDGGDHGRYLCWEKLRYEHTMRIRALTIAKGHSPAYANKHLAALRKTLRHAWKLGLMTAEEYQRAADIDGVDGSRLPPGRNVAGSEMAAMLRVCLEDDSPAGVRDAAILSFMQSTGGRRFETSSAQIDNYDPGTRTASIIGKRNKERELDIHEQAAVYLGRWLVMLGRREGPMFCPIDRWGNLRRGGLTPGAITAIVNKRRLQAGLPPLSPHDFRRTLIGDLLDDGVDLATVQQIVDHESPATTAKYDRRPRRTRKAAIERLSKRLPSPESLRDDDRTPARRLGICDRDDEPLPHPGNET
jgi:site-specific recombinase XerD